VSVRSPAEADSQASDIPGVLGCFAVLVGFPLLGVLWFLGVIGPAPAVTCSLPDKAQCPTVPTEVGWSNPGDFRATEMHFTRPPRLVDGRQEWDVVADDWMEPEFYATCVQTREATFLLLAKITCTFQNHVYEPSDLPWDVPPTALDRLMSWCGGRKDAILAAGKELDIGQGLIPSGATELARDYHRWSKKGDEFTENLERACQAAFDERQE
jgi:hypothetical protein